MDEKIIQICCAICESSGSLGKERLYALTDQGNIWFKTPFDSKGRWHWEKMDLPPKNVEKDVSPPRI